MNLVASEVAEHLTKLVPPRPPELAAMEAEAARKIPRGEHVVIPAAGHIVNLENPAAFNRALTDWLARH